ncbi:MAG: J domain-containing protein [Alphaproteobacteria bacterium]|nr:J domain-containing protein [Alphaproteobacteria bacterium]
MAKDLYEILGVGRDATEDDIRKAYRELAKSLHPDLNPGDAEAEERFKAVSAAYGLLKDAEKRAQYDRGEIDETGAERPEHRYYRDYADAGHARQYYSSSGFDDLGAAGGIFDDLFGGRRGGADGSIKLRGGDAYYQLRVDFLEAVNGAKKRIAMPDGGSLDLTIPAGVEPGQVLRLKGKGMPGIGGGPPGDALVEVAVGTHPVFKRDGDDIRVEMPITIDEAVLGGKIDVPTIAGRVSMTVPKAASSGQVLRLKGKGVKHRKSDRRGDQLVALKIVLPGKVDAELEAFFESWRESHRYDPRAGLREGSG